MTTAIRHVIVNIGPHRYESTDALSAAKRCYAFKRGSYPDATVIIRAEEARA